MADMSTILKNTAFTLSFTLYKNDGTIVANPGTYTKKVSIDGGAVADIAASVTEEDTTYGQLSLVIAAGEMNGDWIWVYITDNTAGTVPFIASFYPAAGNAYAEAALVHAHVGTIDGHITADYAAAEKTAVDKITTTPPTAADNATAVWTAGTKALTDKAGFSLATAPPTAAEVWTAGTRALTDKSGYSGIATNMVAAAPSLTPVLEAITAIDLSGVDVDLTPVLDALDAVLAKTNTIGALAITVTSPVAASGTITLYPGDDYSGAEARSVAFLVADSGHALGLDDAEAVVKLKATQATWEAASVASTTAGYTVTFEATAAQTAAVTRAQHYELEATLANGHVVTLAKGSLVTRADIPAVV